MMATEDRERASYYAWGASLALHGLIAGMALAVSAQVKPVVKEEVFRWDVALVSSLEAMQRAEEPASAPALPPSNPAPVRTLPAVEPLQPVARPSSPEVVRPSIAPPQPEPVKEIIEAKAKPVEPQEIKEEEPKKEEVTPQEVAKPEPVVHEQHPVPVSKKVMQPVETVAAAQAYEPPAPAQAHHAEAAPVVHHESLSPEEMAPEWRPLVAVGEGPGKTVAEPAASSPVPAESNTVAAAPVQAQSPTPLAAKAAPVRPATKADNAWLAESLGRRIREVTRYPSSARLNGTEGKVVLRVVLRADGQLAEVTVHRSSGHEVLDRAAMETIRLACPLHMKQVLSAPEVAVYVPIVYSLAG